MFYVLFYLSPAVFTEGDGVLPDGPLTAAVGENVMFTTTLTPTETQFVVVDWKLNFSKVIIISTNLANNTGPEYEGRITLFPSTGSLELRSLTLNDIGEYSVSITQADGTNQLGRTTLEIHGEQILKSNSVIVSAIFKQVYIILNVQKYLELLVHFCYVLFCFLAIICDIIQIVILQTLQSGCKKLNGLFKCSIDQHIVKISLRTPFV